MLRAGPGRKINFFNGPGRAGLKTYWAGPGRAEIFRPVQTTANNAFIAG
jgi:hypothetical protein